MARKLPPRRPFVTRPVRRPALGVQQNRVVTVLGGASEEFSTFTAADYTPPADDTPTTLTFTLKDSTDTAIAGVGVTYA